MAALVTIQDDELRALCSRLNNMALKPADRKQLLTDIGVEMETQTKERFETKTTPDGDTWKDLADSTKYYYRKKFGSDDPRKGLLYRSGSLLDSIESQPDSWKVLVGATKIYATVHQLGWKEKNISARPYLGLSAENKSDIIGIINGFLARIGK
ncbi:MAG: phage virion morphogenesis protein [Bacteroides sp.]|nr:phage virion morphogenesis protein [Prevotella sp.]MCM1407059.1 phage virion morphogenesis protein [Treponema brennaborense]MCM1470211.1 phage virion morphogenesis protein [Bacteroides sp.]